MNPPSGQTCSQFLDPFIARAGGYLTNPTASTGCEYCQFRTTDQFLSTSFNIEYGHHWRNFGFLWVFLLSIPGEYVLVILGAMEILAMNHYPLARGEQPVALVQSTYIDRCSGNVAVTSNSSL